MIDRKNNCCRQVANYILCLQFQEKVFIDFPYVVEKVVGATRERSQYCVDSVCFD